MRPGLALLSLLVGGLALPGAAGAGEAGCGGDAGSSAEVVEGSRGRGPVVARPGSLCADLAERRPPSSVRIDVLVGASPPGSEAGEEAGQPQQRRR